MLTRKELHEQVRRDQRDRQTAPDDQSHKSAIVGMGKRDPQTGQHEVLLPDGSVEVGEKVFSSSLPEGSQVLGILQEAGGWLLDERDVTARISSAAEEPVGKIKYLYSIINSTTRKTEYWVGGWQAQPKFLFVVQDFIPLTPFPSFNIRLSNRAKSAYTVDLGKVTGSGLLIPGFPPGSNKAGYFVTLDQNGSVVYQSRTLVGDRENFFSIGLVSNSFYYAPINDASSILTGSWTTCFQGIATSGYGADITNVRQYHLPAFISLNPASIYRGDAPDGTSLVYQTFAINKTGNCGVGRLAATPYSSSQLYWLEVGMLGAAQSLTFLPLQTGALRAQYRIDCFDRIFSVFSRTDLDLAKQKTVAIDFYKGLTGEKTNTKKTKVYPIPLKQRSLSPIIIDASYHP
ncbi:MAG: hypothetical protein KME27_10680 [Lyngbya sp. HA4199-MV5]|jgi:hypothetical protein|nr:hypothetical protein [Lyngbya sp. HA4199-MV5]